MRIQHNIMAMNAYRNYTNNVSAMKKNLEKLSSGYKINRAGDDAAGLAISEKMRAQITGLQTAQKNAKDGISLVQTAEGALTEVHDMLNRMVELATQSANGTYDNTTDRYQLQKEVDQLLDEINRIADSSNFNGIKLLDGTLGLNQEAITGIKTVAAEAAVDPAVISGAASVSGVHGANADSFNAPSITVDLSDVKVVTTDANRQVNIKIGTGITLTATIGAKGTATAGTIINALTTKYKGTATANTGASQSVKIGNAYYKVTAGTGKQFKLELAGVASDTAGKVLAVSTTAKNQAKFTASMASSFNTAINPGAAVTISAANANDKVKMPENIIHGLVDYNKAVAEGDMKRWGADINIKASKAMADGNTLTIDGKVFEIKLSASKATSSITNANSSTAKSVITISKNATTASAQLKELMDVIEGAKAGRFTVSAKNNTNQLHFDVRSTVTASKVASLSSAAVKGLVSLKNAGTGAKNTGVEFNVDTTKLIKGDTINVGGNKFVYQGTGTNAFASAAGLKTLLENKFGANYVTTAAGATVKFTVRASKASAAAPRILGRGLTLQIGDTADSYNQLNVAVQDMHASSLGLDELKISDEVSAQQAISKIKSAINTVSDVRGTLGATQNRLDHTINNLSVMTENIQDAESTIRDTDVADEMMAYTKNNILIQSAQAMLAQANQVPQGVLQLLQ